MGSPIDLLSLDGRVARAHASVAKTLARLDASGSADDAKRVADEDPFGALRDVAGQSTYRALIELAPGPFGADHVDALLRWVHELTQTRISYDLLGAEAAALHAPDPLLSPRLLASKDPSDAAHVAKTFAEALTRLHDATDAKRITQAIERLTALAAPVLAVRQERRLRRFEVARRLGLAHPWSLVLESAKAPTAKSGAAVSAVIDLARRVLDATEPVAVEQHKQRRRREGALPPIVATLDDAFARDARDGWPAYLNPRWLEEVFRALAPRFPEHGDVKIPAPLGAASFLRAARSWGAALRRRGTARSLPFALARDPYPIEALGLGDALALAVASRVFAKRKLGSPMRAADAHARSLGRVLFHELRVKAAMVILGGQESRDDAQLEEMTARIFGAPLDRLLAAAWSHGGFASTYSEAPPPAQLLGALRGYELARLFLDRFDEDWFDNPKAGAHIAAISAGPVWTSPIAEPREDSGAPSIDLATHVPQIAKSFEELIG